MTKIEYVTSNDRTFWYSLDKHLPEKEFENKVANKQGYVLFADDTPVGLLRYNLFWDNTPFCTLLFIDCTRRLYPLMLRILFLSLFISPLFQNL